MNNYTKLYSIEEAMQLLDSGYALSRAKWNNINKFVISLTNEEISDIFLTDEDFGFENKGMMLMIVDNCKFVFDWKPTLEDSLADDWYIIINR